MRHYYALRVFPKSNRREVHLFDNAADRDDYVAYSERGRQQYGDLSDPRDPWPIASAVPANHPVVQQARRGKLTRNAPLVQWHCPCPAGYKPFPPFWMMR